jgi:hypothetical protein
MKRRHVVALLGLFSFGGAAAVWRLLQPFRRPDPGEHLARTMAAVAEAMFPGDGLPGVTDLGLHLRVLAMADLDVWIATAVTCSTSARPSRGRPIFWRSIKCRGSRPSMRRLHRRTKAFSHSCSRSDITWARPITRRLRSSRPLPIRVRRSRTASPISRNAPHERRRRWGCDRDWRGCGRRSGGLRSVSARTIGAAARRRAAL